MYYTVLGVIGFMIGLVAFSLPVHEYKQTFYLRKTDKCINMINHLSGPKMMILEDTNPKKKHLVDMVINDLSYIYKMSEDDVKKCLAFK